MEWTGASQSMARICDCRNDQASQNRNDCDHHHYFKQCERAWNVFWFERALHWMQSRN